MYSVSTLRRSVYAFAVSASSCSAFAADLIDEVVVTAGYRERPASQVPLSLSVLDESALDTQAAPYFENLIALVPNMNWSGDGNRARYFQIRGVGELAQYQGAPNPSVGFIIDDIDFSGIGAIATQFDIEQIEVLRGPQGTRYGANALAGLVYVRSKEATGARDGRLSLSAGQDGEFGIGLAGGGSFSGSGNFRLSAHHYRSNGFRDNPFLARDDTNDRSDTTLRAKLSWEAGSDWRLNLTGIWADADNGYDAFAIDNSLTVLSDNPGKDAQESVGASFKAVRDDLGGYSFTSITAAAYSTIDFSFDADWGNPTAWAPVTYDFISSSERTRRTLSQEFRLASAEEGRIFADTTDWLIGFYVNRLDEDLSTRQ